ncbi:MAG: hypothetical protein J5J06_00710 [Phycisphaerae bacterium]|nr:hypothetical protein [Phycisphaerae bacterium]
MHGLTRLFLGILCLLVIAQAVVLWSATGRAAFTRYHDPKRAVDQAGATSARDIFADTGLEDETGPMEKLPNQFTLGLLPSGPDRHMVSLATLSLPPGLALLILAIGPLFRKKPRQAELSSKARLT